MKLYVYRCAECGLTIEDENPSPPVCENGHGLMVRIYAVNYGRRSPSRLKPEKAREKRWQTEREHDQKEQADNEREVSENVEKWKRNYVAGELHHKHGNPDEPNTKVFRDAGHVPRTKTSIEHGFEKK